MNWSKEWKPPLTPDYIKPILEQIDKVKEAQEWCDKITKSFTFKDGHKARTIDVIIIGDLGLDFDEDGWNIYHIPTLSCFSNAVPSFSKPMEDQFKSYSKHEIICEQSYNYTSDQLLAWMKKVQENYPTAWTMLRLLTPENFKDKGEIPKETIQKWCLSVPVGEE